MNNSDMPAMPAEQSTEHFSLASTHYSTGLTKREYMTAHMTVGVGEIEFADTAALGRFIGREFDSNDIMESLKAYAEANAKFAVMKVDARLKELSK